MSSGELLPGNPDPSEPAATEVQFALVIARMIDTVKNSPQDVRQIIYDLARYKLQEQFTHVDAKNTRRVQQALEAAIRGVEAFSRQQASIPSAAPPVGLENSTDFAATTPQLKSPASLPPFLTQPHFEISQGPRLGVARPTHFLWPRIKRTFGMLAVIAGLLTLVQQRERLASLIQDLPKDESRTTPVKQRPPSSAMKITTPEPPTDQKQLPLRPTDYGVYAVDNDALTELQPLPGQPPDIRVAISAALTFPSRTSLPNGHPRFIVFRRDVASTVPDHPEVRIIAKIAREFSAGINGKRPREDSWVIRNISFPFRSSPVSEIPEMIELHSADPALELTPGRYALVLKSESYDFTIEGEPVDPKHCIEQIDGSNGTFYSDCKKPDRR